MMKLQKLPQEHTVATKIQTQEPGFRSFLNTAWLVPWFHLGISSQGEFWSVEIISLWYKDSREFHDLWIISNSFKFIFLSRQNFCYSRNKCSLSIIRYSETEYIFLMESGKKRWLMFKEIHLYKLEKSIISRYYKTIQM